MSQAMSNVMALLAGAAPSGLGQGKVTADGKQAATASDAFSKLLSMMQLGTSSLLASDASDSEKGMLKEILALLQGGEGMPEELAQLLSQFNITTEQWNQLLEQLQIDAADWEQLQAILTRFLDAMNRIDSPVSHDVFSIPDKEAKQAALRDFSQQISDWLQGVVKEQKALDPALLEKLNRLMQSQQTAQQAAPVSMKEPAIIIPLAALAKLANNEQMQQRSDVREQLLNAIQRVIGEAKAANIDARDGQAAESRPWANRTLEISESGSQMSVSNQERGEFSYSLKGQDMKQEPVRIAQFQVAQWQGGLQETAHASGARSASSTTPGTTVWVNAEQLVPEMTGMLMSKLKLTQQLGSSEAKVTLYPESLGQVNVKLTMQDGKLVAQFMTDTMMGKDLLETNLSGLRATLQQQGIQVEKMEVSHQMNHQPSSQFQDRGQQQGSFEQAGGQASGTNDPVTNELEEIGAPDAEEGVEAEYTYGASAFTSGKGSIDFTA